MGEGPGAGAVVVRKCSEEVGMVKGLGCYWEWVWGRGRRGGLCAFVACWWCWVMIGEVVKSC